MSTRSFLQVIACLPVPGAQGCLATYQQLINNLSTTYQQLINNLSTTRRAQTMPPGSHARNGIRDTKNSRALGLSRRRARESPDFHPLRAVRTGAEGLLSRATPGQPAFRRSAPPRPCTCGCSSAGRRQPVHRCHGEAERLGIGSPDRRGTCKAPRIRIAGKGQGSPFGEPCPLLQPSIAAMAADALLQTRSAGGGSSTRSMTSLTPGSSVSL